MRIQEYTENILENPSNLQTYTITQNLGNDWRMRITTPAIDTRPIFLMRSSLRQSVIGKREKIGLGARLHLVLPPSTPCIVP